MRLKEHCANFTPPAAPYKTAKIKTTFKNISAIDKQTFSKFTPMDQTM